MRVKFNIDHGTKRAGQIIDVDSFYLKSLLKKGIVSPVTGGTPNPSNKKDKKTSDKKQNLLTDVDTND